jgi:hypothetical protein
MNQMYPKPIQSPKVPTNGKRNLFMNMMDLNDNDNDKRPVPDFTELELFINR